MKQTWYSNSIRKRTLKVGKRMYLMTDNQNVALPGKPDLHKMVQLGGNELESKYHYQKHYHKLLNPFPTPISRNAPPRWLFEQVIIDLKNWEDKHCLTEKIDIAAYHYFSISNSLIASCCCLFSNSTGKYSWQRPLKAQFLF